MAEFYKIKNEIARQEWLSKLPELPRSVARQYPANKLYRLNGDRGIIKSYTNDGKVTMQFTEQFNLTMLNREVFGIDPGELTECDLPHPDEDLGCIADTKEKSDAWIQCLKMIHLHEAGKNIGDEMPTDDEITLYGELRDELQRREKANQALLRRMTND